MCSIFSKNVSKCLGLLCAAACIGFVSDGWGSSVKKRNEVETSSVVSVKATITAIVGIKWGTDSKTITLVGEDGKQASERARTAEFEVDSYTKGKLKVTSSSDEMHGDNFYARGPAGSTLEYKVLVNEPGTENFEQWKQTNSNEILTWKKGYKLKIRGELVHPDKLGEENIGDYTAQLNVEITPVA